MHRLSLITASTIPLLIALAAGNPAAAAAPEPTMHQIYEAATTGHLTEAQEMITQVLSHHPKSAKAHWVQAEVYAKANKTNMARSEVLEAERLNPGRACNPPGSWARENRASTRSIINPAFDAFSVIVAAVTEKAFAQASILYRTYRRGYPALLLGIAGAEPSWKCEQPSPTPN